MSVTSLPVNLDAMTGVSPPSDSFKRGALSGTVRIPQRVDRGSPEPRRLRQ
jgi:hypothetical protein